MSRCVHRRHPPNDLKSDFQSCSASPSSSIALFFPALNMSRTVFHPPRPIYLIQSPSCNWNFYWDEGDNSCKCANRAPRTLRDVKPSGGIKKSKVWNAARSCVMYHAGAIKELRLPSSECNRGHAPLLISTSVHKGAVCSPVVALGKSVFITFKSKIDVRHISHANSITEHMPRQLCDYNQAAREKCLVWSLRLDLSSFSLSGVIAVTLSHTLFGW